MRFVSALVRAPSLSEISHGGVGVCVAGVEISVSLSASASGDSALVTGYVHQPALSAQARASAGGWDWVPSRVLTSVGRASGLLRAFSETSAPVTASDGSQIGSISVTGEASVTLVNGVLKVDVTGGKRFAEADESVAAGQAVYLKPNGHVGLACADAANRAFVFGVVMEDTDAGFLAPIMTAGSVTLGAAPFTTGARYFLDATTPGLLTTTAPQGSGQYVVCVARARTDSAIDVSISQPILL